MRKIIIADMSQLKIIDLLDISVSEDDTTEDTFYKHDAVDSLKHKPAQKLYLEEIKLLRSYTYDNEPIIEYRQVTDYMVIKECNRVLWRKISAFLGDFHANQNSIYLYRSKDVISLIAKLICQKNCYYLPGNCFLEHNVVHLKDFFKRSLHEIFNPEFDALLREGAAKVVKLEVAESGQPLMLKLADDIGVNTVLKYQENEILDIDFDVFNENFWNYVLLQLPLKICIPLCIHATYIIVGFAVSAHFVILLK